MITFKGGERMQKTVELRDKATNQRVMDAILKDDGSVMLEIKNRGNFRHITLEDMLEQIKQAQKLNIV